MQNLWPKLMTDKEEAKLFRALQAELEDLEGLVAEGCAALPLLEGQLMRAACDDPGPLIMDQVVLPLLQQRLTAKAEAFNASGKPSQVNKHDDTCLLPADSQSAAIMPKSLSAYLLYQSCKGQEQDSAHMHSAYCDLGSCVSTCSATARNQASLYIKSHPMPLPGMAAVLLKAEPVMQAIMMLDRCSRACDTSHHAEHIMAHARGLQPLLC